MSDDLEALYPFLYADTGDLTAVLDQVRASTVAKAAEIGELRRAVAARQVAAFGRPGDIAVGLSTSGNSENLLRAFDEASRRGMLTIGLAGYDGGRMAELDSIDYLFVVPSSSVHRIQEAQTTIYQVLWELTVVELTAEEMSHVPRHTW